MKKLWTENLPEREGELHHGVLAIFFIINQMWKLMTNDEFLMEICRWIYEPVVVTFHAGLRAPPDCQVESAPQSCKTRAHQGRRPTHKKNHFHVKQNKKLVSLWFYSWIFIFHIFSGLENLPKSMKTPLSMCGCDARCIIEMFNFFESQKIKEK